MASANLTRRALSLGNQDSTTGWYSPTYTETTIKGLIQPAGAVIAELPVGNYARYPHTLFTTYTVAVGDEIKDAFTDCYVVRSVDKWVYLDQFSHYQCQLEKRSPYAQRPTTSGTWHLDSASLKTDQRYRTKLWLDTYLEPSDLELDNGTTDAVVKTMFSNPPEIPISQLFITKTIDGVFSIDKQAAEPINAYDHSPYAFIETVPITCYAVDKAGLTATNLIEQMEQEIRHVCTDHPLGSLRSIQSTGYRCTNIGGVKLWEATVTVRYIRANDDYTPSYPTITYGDSQASTYTFPNVTDVRFNDPDTGDAYLLPPGRVGAITQILGMDNYEVTLTCDLTMENTSLTWKRPQTTTPKTDSIEEQVFKELKFAGKTDSDQVYQNLDLGYGSTIPVRLVSVNVDRSGDDAVLQVTFRRYSATDGASGNYSAWYGIG